MSEKPAFPQLTKDQWGNAAMRGVMTLRAYAAIHLRVPDSGEEWLDAMIRRAIHQEDARAAMVGMLGSHVLEARSIVGHNEGVSEEGVIAHWAHAQADAMQEERER